MFLSCYLYLERERRQLICLSARFRSSKSERMVDAMAPEVYEGRDKLRKATGSRK